METTNDNQNFDIMDILDDLNTIEGNALSNNVNQNSWDDVAVVTASSTNQSITTSSDVDVAIVNDSSNDLSSIPFNQLYRTMDFIDYSLYFDYESSDLAAEQNQDKRLDVIISKYKYKSAKSDSERANVDIQTDCVAFETVNEVNNLSNILGFEPQSSFPLRDERNDSCSTSKLLVLSIDEHGSQPNTSQGSLKLADTSVSPQVKRPVLDLLKKKLFANGMKTGIIHHIDPILEDHSPMNQNEVARLLQMMPRMKDLVKFHGVSNTFTWIACLCNIHYRKFIDISSPSQRIRHALLNLRQNVKPTYSQCHFC